MVKISISQPENNPKELPSELSLQLSDKMTQKQAITDINKQILSDLCTGVLIFDTSNKLLEINSFAKKLLRGDEKEILGQYKESLLALLANGENKYLKQVTGVVGKPLNGILHIIGNLKVVELSESYEVRLGEAAHELRRPLTNVKTLVDTLYLWGAGEDPEARKRFLGQLHAQTERLVSTVNDLLNLSRMQAGSVPIKFEQIALKVLVLECFDMLREQASKQDIELICEVSDDFVLIADTDKITHVVQNLIENAIRYNRQNGKVIVKAKEGENSFSVCDTGSGIAKENAEIIFERFKRVNKEIPGTGLGLSIVKTIVDLHGGKIELDSEIGKGSEFKVQIPMKKLPLMTMVN